MTDTSVLPKPTSPHTSRSIGLSLSISFLISSTAFFWSGVNSNINASSKIFWSGVSFENAWPICVSLFAYKDIKRSAICATFSCNLFFVFSQSPLPSLFNLGTTPSRDTNLRTSLNCSNGTSNSAFPRYTTLIKSLFTPWNSLVSIPTYCPTPYVAWTI